MPRFDKTNIDGLKKSIYNTYAHDARVKGMEYQWGEDCLKIRLWNPIFYVKADLIFHNIEIVFAKKGREYGSRETVVSLTVEDDFSELLANCPNCGPCLEDTIYLLFQMFSGEELHIAAKEVTVEITRSYVYEDSKMDGGTYIANGFLVTAQPAGTGYRYLGVDNDAWPVLVGEPYGALRAALNGAETPDEETPVLLNADMAALYLKLCRASHRTVRLLYCEVTTEHGGSYDPVLHQRFALESQFLGYDLAYPNGDYFSAVLNDLICREGLFAEQYELNQSGLLDSLSAASAFALERKRKKEELDRTGQGNLLEGDEFYVFGVYAVSPGTEESETVR